MSIDFFNFRFVSEGFSLSFDQVFVQGLARTNRSVAQYYLRTSNDDDVYVTITKPGGDQPRVKFANLLFMNLIVINRCISHVVTLFDISDHKKNYSPDWNYAAY